MSGNCEQIRIRQNYTMIEATEPTSNLIYFARCLTFGKSFCVSVDKILERNSDFSFIVGFTTCSPGTILNESVRHSTEQCIPTGCGGHSQQVKIFNANVSRAKVTFERQANGEIYFAIDSSMPIHIQFDSNSCAINLAKHEQLTPYIQLCGSVLSLKSETSFRKLNIESAMAVRRRQPLRTATAFGPRPPRSQILPPTDYEQAHQAFVASSSLDTIFIPLRYPENDIKLSVNRMAVLRKNKNGERYAFYFDKELKCNSEVTFQVTKLYHADKYDCGFECGVTTSCSETVQSLERQFIIRSEISHYSVKINRDLKLNDKFTFKRGADGFIQVMKNGIAQSPFMINREYQETESLLAFVILNGTASGIIITNSTNKAEKLEFGEIYAWPPTDFKTTENVTMVNQTLLSWCTESSETGVIVNAKPFDTVLKFIIREVQTSLNVHSLTFGLIHSTNIGFATPREIATRLDIHHDNLIQSPALGLKFSLYRTPYGKVTLKYDDGQSDPINLFLVEPSQCYYPVLILNGSVVAIELLPNTSKKIVKRVSNLPTVTTTRPQLPLPTNECKICFDRPINSVFFPCGHRFACLDCARDWMSKGNLAYGGNLRCPVCRNMINELLQTYD